MSTAHNNLREKYQSQYKKAYQILNEEQKNAVDEIEGPVMVIAGPGTGKTQILAMRIGKILESQDIAAHNILCLTFTDAATIAMRRRLVKIIGPEGHKVHIYTFHAFCNQVIQENLGYFGNYRQLDALDDLEQIDVYKELIDALPSNHILKRLKGDAGFEAKRLHNLFQMMKKENLKDVDMEKRIDDYLLELEEDTENGDFFYRRKYKEFKVGDKKPAKWEALYFKMNELRAAIKLYDAYNNILHARSRYDYNDMLLWVLNAFRTNDQLLANYQERYQYFLVDEFQDTNGAQKDILEALISFMDTSPNVFVVGDDDQSVFKFQGANLNNIRDFKSKYKPSTVVLEKNYRSNQKILNAAATLIDFNTERIINDPTFLSEKKLIGAGVHKDDLTDVRLCCYNNIVQEQADIIDQITKMYEGGEVLNNVAVLYRKHKQVENIVEILEKKNIPINIKRKVDVLKLPLIENILNILYYIQAEYENPNKEEGRLFELMHYHFFSIESRDIARIALYCREGTYDSPIFWRDVMEDKKLLSDLGIKSINEIYTLSNLLGKWVADIANITVQNLFENVINEGFILQNILSHPDKTWLLQVLSTFFDYIKEKTHKFPDIGLNEYLETIDKLKEADLPIGINKIVHSDKGVNFITTHSSKGMEFNKVFLIGCTKDIWDKGGSARFNYSYPKGVNADSETNVEDERRLFFVAMTRAKTNLQISFSLQKENGKELGASQFVDEILASTEITMENVTVSEESINDFQAYVMTQFQKEIKLIDHDLIDRILEKYKLSVTGLNKYLKCPMSFYFETILRIPSARNKYMGFGRAIHRSFQLYFEDLKEAKNVNKATICNYFEQGMREHRSHFTKKEYKDLMDYGNQILEKYYVEYLKDLVHASDYMLEVKIDNAEYGGVPIKGVLDNVEIHKDFIHVVDYKTGNALNSSTKKKLKKPNASDENGGDYWRQIVYYKILVDSDKRYNWHMTSGEIDFVEPDRKTQKFSKTKYVVSPVEIEIVGNQIIDTWNNIKSHKFNQLCDDENCYWCDFVRNDFVFSGEFENDLLEDIQES